MEKAIIRWSYLAGVACAVVALVWRAAALFGWMASGIGAGNALSYMTFLNGAVLFFLMSIATSFYATAQKG